MGFFIANPGHRSPRERKVHSDNRGAASGQPGVGCRPRKDVRGGVGPPAGQDWRSVSECGGQSLGIPSNLRGQVTLASNNLRDSYGTVY